MGFSQRLALWWVPSDLHDTSGKSYQFSLQTLFVTNRGVPTDLLDVSIIVNLVCALSGRRGSS